MMTQLVPAQRCPRPRNIACLRASQGSPPFIERPPRPLRASQWRRDARGRRARCSAAGAAARASASARRVTRQPWRSPAASLLTGAANARSPNARSCALARRVPLRGSLPGFRTVQSSGAILRLGRRGFSGACDALRCHAACSTPHRSLTLAATSQSTGELSQETR